METGTGSVRGNEPTRGVSNLEVGKRDGSNLLVLDGDFDSRRALRRTRALVSALASSRLVTIGIPNSAAFLLMRYSSFSIRCDAGSPSWLGMLITSRISLFWR